MADRLNATTVLIVDDDEGIRETLRFMLEDAGYSVIEAENGSEALDRLRASPGSLVVLLDVKMPVLTGEQLLEKVVQEPLLLQRHAFIVDTASPQAINPQMIELMAKLSIPFVPKPFGIDELLATIRLAEARMR